MSVLKKPFLCSIEGCDMSFTNEDHLTVHRKKHDMILNFGSKANAFVADETPTPTRFIRNCEEVGLFQDLQNVNPFEETFKRANELVKSGNIPTIQHNTEDTLHTPHVFPIIPDNFTTDQPTPNKLNLANFDLKTPVINQVEPKSSELPSDIESQQIHNTENGIQVIKPEKKIVKCKRKTVQAPTATEATKNRIKSVITNKPVYQILGLPQGISFAPVVSFPKQTYTVIAPPVVQLVQPEPPKPIKALVKKEEVDEQKLKTRVRNRAASERARKKHKQWISTLVKQNQTLMKLNGDLTKEVKNLKEQLVKYKQTLMEHADCDVSKAKGLKPSTSLSLSEPTSSKETPKPQAFKKIRPNIQPLAIPIQTLPKSIIMPATIVNASILKFSTMPTVTKY